jgi:hypothetical protein
MTLQPLPSEFHNTWGKLYFFFISVPENSAILENVAILSELHELHVGVEMAAADPAAQLYAKDSLGGAHKPPPSAIEWPRN